MGRLLIPSLGANVSLEGLQIRSMVFSEHPLVLGALLVVGLAAFSSLRKAMPFGLVAVLLLSAIWSTGSGGPLAIGSTYVLLRLSQYFLGFSWSGLVKPSQLAFMLMGLSCILLGRIIDYRFVVDSADTGVASWQYRLALYGAALRMIVARPFGYGIQGLPEGVYIVSSRFGPLDLSRTLDAEPVLLISEIGLVGVIVYVALGLIASLGWESSHWVSHAAVLVTGTGGFLALHSWAGLGALWLLLLGATFAKLRSEHVRVSHETRSAAESAADGRSSGPLALRMIGSRNRV